MKRQSRTSSPTQALRKTALAYPETEEGVACEGTSLEKRTIKVRGKAFLFLGKSDAMLKLGDSLHEATKLSSQLPGSCQVGAHGWVKLTFGESASPPAVLLARWVEESYRLLAPKQPSRPPTE